MITPERAVSGFYFSVVVLPALTCIAGAFWGRRAALGTGIVLAVLSLINALSPPRPMLTQPVQWVVGFTASNQALRATLAPPPRSRSAEIVGARGSATLFVCRGRGTTDDLEILAGGAGLRVIARPTASFCWLQLEVPPERLGGGPLEVTIRPRPQYGAGESGPTILVGGYTRPTGNGGRSGGAAFYDGATWRTDDLSPTAAGPQAGRYFVELRLADAAGRAQEIWY